MLQKTIIGTLIYLFIPILTFARPLGYIPFESTEKINIHYAMLSDAWTSPHSYKNSPVRYFSAGLKVPLYYNEQLQVNFGSFADNLSLGESTIEFRDHTIHFDSALSSESLGFQANYRFPNNHILQFMLYYRSDSDRPFQDERDRWIGGSLLHTFNHTEKSRWFAAVDFDRNRGLLDNRVFPYFGIIYNPSDEWESIIGFPVFKVTHGKPGDLRYRLYISPFEAYLETEKKFLETYLLRIRTEYSIQSYLVSERINDEDRLYFQDINFNIRLKKTLTEMTSVTYGGGYAFERRVYGSNRLFAHTGNMYRLDNDFFINIGIEFIL